MIRRRRPRDPPRLDVRVTLERFNDPPPPWWRDVRGIGAGLLGIGLILLALAASFSVFR